MQPSILRTFLAVLLPVLPLYAPCRAVYAETSSLEQPEYYAEIAERFSRVFPHEHVLRLRVDDAVSQRAWERYLSSLDYDRVFFLGEDIARFESSRLELDDQIKDGDMAFAYEVFSVFRQRMRNRYEYVKKLLEAGFDLDRDETYVWKRKDAPWPRDEAEWDDVWRRRIKNEYIRRLIAEELADQAGATNLEETVSEDDPEEDAPPAEKLSPEESIEKRYRQTLTVIEDSDAEWVLEKYLSAFSHAFDPHSDYMSASAVEDFHIEMKLSLVGIGTLLRAEDGAAKVVRVIPGGPADRDKRDVRLKPGDKIIAVAQGDGEPVDIPHRPLYRIVKLIRGEKGSRVVLTVIPASDPTGTTTKKVDLIRDEVRLEAQAAKGKVHAFPGDDGVERRLGIVTLPAFYGNMNARSMEDPEFRSSSQDVRTILGDMKEKGVDGLLLDLRGNGGGSLLEAVRMTGFFVPTGPVVQVRERHALRVLRDDDRSVDYEGPLVVLVNRLSASASEILAGALQDYGRAVIVGDSKTHGKGTVQSVLKLGRDRRLGSLKITTASYFRVNGGSTQVRGIAPDIVVPSALDYMELGEDYLTNAIPWTFVKEAAHRPVADVGEELGMLEERSVARRNGDPRYAAHRKQLARIEKMNDTRELSLDLDERSQLAKMEKELSDLQQQLLDAGGLGVEGDDEDEDLTRDLVLLEALSILGDLAAFSERRPSVAESTADDADSISRTIVEWLRSRM
ncbi:carboxy terminal-processing peptidase [Verrucomicrobiota bacterium]